MLEYEMHYRVLPVDFKVFKFLLYKGSLYFTQSAQNRIPCNTHLPGHFVGRELGDVSGLERISSWATEQYAKIALVVGVYGTVFL